MTPARAWGQIRMIRSYLPPNTLTNEALSPHVGWTAEEIEAKTGIRERRIAGEDECVSDLATAAARRLLEDSLVDPSTVQFLILCTQTPDHFLPTTACIVQDRAELPDSCAAFDVNLGCSGYVYALGMASAFIQSGMFRRGIVATADTYTKFIHPEDRSVRTLFGDGATATLVEASDRPGLDSFVFGSDGSGAQNLIIPAGGVRLPRSAASCIATTDESGNRRSPENLYMNGAEILTFTLRRVPQLVDEALAAAGWTKDDVDWFVFHQANRFLLNNLRKKMGIPPEKMIEYIAPVGNTVSSTIPLALENAAREGQFSRGDRMLLVGFGVGYSWAASTLTWDDKASG